MDSRRPNDDWTWLPPDDRAARFILTNDDLGIRQIALRSRDPDSPDLPSEPDTLTALVVNP